MPVEAVVPGLGRIVEQALVAAALGHSPATPAGGVEAEIVRFASMEDLQAAPDAAVRGKIVYIDLGQVHPMQDGSGYGPQTRVRGAGPGVAAAKGAAAFVMRSVGSDEDRMPHTGTTRYVDGKPTIPAFALSAPDADQVSRLVALGEPVRMRLTSTAHTYETHSQNVIGDLPGASRPDEIIVLGSHMDSWDLGTGAIDDGAGGAITVAAAKAIADSGRRPARTLRVIFYGSEEVAQPTPRTGNGGGVYARNQGAALDKHIIAGESDFGADRVYALRLPAGAQGSDFQKAATRVLYPIGVLASDRVETEGGVDVGPMGPLGVPFFGLAQDGTRYFDLHHTANDTLDKIDPAQLSQNVAAWAGLLWLIADSDVDFRAMRPAAPATPARLAPAAGSGYRAGPARGRGETGRRSRLKTHYRRFTYLNQWVRRSRDLHMPYTVAVSGKEVMCRSLTPSWMESSMCTVARTAASGSARRT